MKSDKVITILTVLLIGVLLVLLQSCKDDAQPVDDDDVFTSRLSQTWKVKRVTADDVDVTGAFKNMTITFKADQSYSVTNAVSPIWPASGSFEIVPANDGQYDLKRNDGATVNVTSLSDSSVFLELFYTSQSGRVAGVSGQYIFELTR